MDPPEHAEYSSSKLTKGREGIGEGRGLRIKNGFAEPLVDHGAVTKYALEQRPLDNFLSSDPGDFLG